ncbi:MAG: polysaccharide biosynthesis tyrosine autokinase [Bacteroidetes bacterium]|nr:polysaccharide biosynthesis tyrosine autokinase [Bacteroidota bacterium]
MLQSQVENNIDNYRQRVSRFSSEIDIGLFIYIFKRSLWFIAFFFIISFSAAYLYLRYSQTIYQSSAVIQVNDNNEANQILQLNKSEAGQNKIAETIEQIRSKVFLKRVVEKSDIQVSYFNEGTFKNNELYNSSPYYIKVNIKRPSIYGTKIYVRFRGLSGGRLEYVSAGKPVSLPFVTNSLVSNKDFDLNVTLNTIFEKPTIERSLTENPNSYFIIKSVDDATAELQSKLDIKLLNDMAKTVLITVKDINATKSKDLVNIIAEEYLDFDVERQSESSKSIISFIDGQLRLVYDELKTSENNLQDFRKQKNYTDKTEIISANMARLTSLEDEMLRVEMEEKLLAELQTNIQKNKSIDTYELVSMIAGTEYEDAIKEYTQAIQKLLIEKENLLYEVTPNSENIKQINFQIENQKRLLVESINAVRLKYKTKYTNLLQKSAEYKNKYDNVPEEEVEHSRLMRLFSISEKYYTLLLEKKTEFSISKAGFVSRNVILEKAIGDGALVSPSKKNAFFVAILAAILLSFLLVFIRYLLHDKITSVNEIVKQTHASVSVLGLVPKYENDIPVSQLVVDKNPKSIIAESFRSIRTNFQFINNTEGPKIIAVTSSISGEGKTFVALNIAGILAYSGKKVVILDLDMRKPKIHRGFEVSNEKGMSTILTDMTTIEECIIKSHFPNLDFITAGPIPPNPSELIIGKKLDEVIEALKKKYDYIMIDNPPVGLVTDGITTIQKADYPIYVFRADYSRRSFIQIFDKLKNENNIEHLSVILNGIDVKRGSYGYNYGYGYGYGYGYTYGNGYYSTDDRTHKKKKKNIFGK